MCVWGVGSHSLPALAGGVLLYTFQEAATAAPFPSPALHQLATVRSGRGGRVPLPQGPPHDLLPGVWGDGLGLGRGPPSSPPASCQLQSAVATYPGRGCCCGEKTHSPSPTLALARQPWPGLLQWERDPRSLPLQPPPPPAQGNCKERNPTSPPPARLHGGAGIQSCH